MAYSPRGMRTVRSTSELGLVTSVEVLVGRRYRSTPRCSFCLLHRIIDGGLGKAQLTGSNIGDKLAIDLVSTPLLRVLMRGVKDQWNKSCHPAERRY